MKDGMHGAFGLLAAMLIIAPGWGKVPKMSDGQELTAGPVRLRFADGELRYLYVGDKEIVRRVYFAVRNGKWETAMPRFTQTSVSSSNGGFKIDLKADCRAVGADFSWTGHIEGKSDGTITFRAEGTPGTDFDSNRIGLCVLFGSPSLVGQSFETVNAQNETKAGRFPETVQPQLVAPDFQTLRYTAQNGPTVAVSVVGAKFDMEDQRTYGDSSFKAYAPLSYAYPGVKKGDTKEETVTLTVANASGGAVQKANGPAATVSVGAVLPGIVLPRLVEAAPDAKSSIFGNVNNQADQYKGAAKLTWGYTPFIHLPDNDTAMENPVVLIDQARTAHTYAPNATLLLDPVTLDGTKYRLDGKSDARASEAFGGAWTAVFTHNAALAGISEARLSVAQGAPNAPARRVQQDLATHAGQTLRETTAVSTSSHPSPIDALAVDTPKGTVLWVVNKSARTQEVAVQGLPSGTVALHRVTGGTGDQNETTRVQTDLRLRLAPYEVCRITPQ